MLPDYYITRDLVCQYKNLKFLKENEVRILAASAEWAGTDNLRLQVFAAETPYCDIYDIRFDGKNVTLERTAKLEFLHNRWPILNGEEI